MHSLTPWRYSNPGRLFLGRHAGTWVDLDFRIFERKRREVGLRRSLDRQNLKKKGVKSKNKR
jgi:hypothetical protein